MEVKKMEDSQIIIRNPFRQLGEIPDLDSLENSIFRRVATINLSKHSDPLRASSTKIKLFVKLYENKMKRFTALYRQVKSAHEFYISLSDSIYNGGYNQLRLDIESVLNSIMLLKKLKYNYIQQIKANPSNANQLKREFLGRAGSIIKGLKPAFVRMKTYRTLLIDLPDIDLSVFKVVIVGTPHVGKSSLVSNLTSRKIRIGSYPFTTKEINAGELREGSIRTIIYDTPGLLDRPLEERNNIELRAIAALKHLANLAIFLIDPTEKAGYLLTYQQTVLNSIKSILDGLEFIEVYTHADELTTIPTNVICISNITMYGLDFLKKQILEKAREWYISQRTV
ncbi:MAG: GTPase [Thermoprotei archaeon]